MTGPQQSPGDFLSPAQLRQAVADFFRFLFRSWDFFLRSVRKNALLVLGCSLFGAGISAWYWYNKERTYQTEMIVQQSSLSRKAYHEIISNLNALTVAGGQKELAELLSLPISSVEKLAGLECVNLLNEGLQKDTSSRTGLPFKIRARVYETSVLPQLQAALLNYLNGNPYVKQKREGQIAILQQKLVFIESEQQKLDSLKNNYNRMLTGMRMPSGVYNNAMNPAELYEQSFQLASQKEYILNWLNTESRGILLIDGFKNTGRRTGAPAWLIFGAGLAAGLLLGIGMALLFGIRENLLKPVPSNITSNGLPVKEVHHEYFG